jgi:hypothetical protein
MKIRIGMFAAAALALFLVAAWPVNAANAQAYWGYGVGNRVWGYTEAGQGWQGNGYGYELGYYQAKQTVRKCIHTRYTALNSLILL